MKYLILSLLAIISAVFAGRPSSFQYQIKEGKYTLKYVRILTHIKIYLFIYFKNLGTLYPRLR